MVCYIKRTVVFVIYRVKTNDFEFEVIYFPGHRNDLCAFYFKEKDLEFIELFEIYKGLLTDKQRELFSSHYLLDL